MPINFTRTSVLLSWVCENNTFTISFSVYYIIIVCTTVCVCCVGEACNIGILLLSYSFGDETDKKIQQKDGKEKKLSAPRVIQFRSHRTLLPSSFRFGSRMDNNIYYERVSRYPKIRLKTNNGNYNNGNNYYFFFLTVRPTYGVDIFLTQFRSKFDKKYIIVIARKRKVST